MDWFLFVEIEPGKECGLVSVCLDRAGKRVWIGFCLFR